MTVYIGIVWSENEYEVVWLNEAGAIIGHFTMVPDIVVKVPVALAKKRITMLLLGQSADCLES
jgi:hypothetical protein